MSWTAKPQAERLATAPLDGLGMSQIIKPCRPLVVAGYDETRCRRFGQPLEHVDVTCGALGSRFAQHALNDLGPGTLGTQVLHQLGDRRLTAVYGAGEHHPRPPIGRDHGSTHLCPHSSGLLTAPHRQRDRHFLTARLIATRKVGNGPGQPEYLVDAAGAEASTIDRLVHGLQAVWEWQVAAQVRPRNLAVGLPTAASQAPTLPVASLQYALRDHS